ncbi:MAG: hypothetical protein AB8C84_03800 [Oligoflexales bacterium]
MSLDFVSPTEFFREQIQQSGQRQGIEFSSDIEFYLVNLLCDFIHTSKINSPEEEINILEKPFALVLKTALESPPSDRYRIFRHLGDSSLYVAGYFQDSFNRKVYDIEYVANVGARAYWEAAPFAGEQKSVFIALSERMREWVEVIADVSDQFGRSNKDLLALYDRWTKNPTPRLRRHLEESGINPILTNMKDPQ